MAALLRSIHSFSRLSRATYYTKTPEKKKTGRQAWFFLAGVTTTFAGGAIYVLGENLGTIMG